MKTNVSNLRLISKTYREFSEARSAAICMASWFGEPVTILTQANGYLVVPPELHIKDKIAELFTSWFCRSSDLQRIELLDISAFKSKNLAWTDPDSGLTWDIARLFYKQNETELPNDKSIALNSVNYAGFSDWRMPSIEDLRTLVSRAEITHDNVKLRPEVKQTIPGHRIWSNEKFCKDEVLFDYIQGSTTYQYFKEHDKYRSDPRDGYRETAANVLVRGALN